jgi:hypothetical protein
MPRIHLKPNSAEFAEKQQKTQNSPCDMPGCSAGGAHRAPKDRGLKDYYNFCLEHVQEYNRAWDFFSGMSGREIEDHILNSLYGDRPTRRYDVEGAAEEALWQKARQTYSYKEENPKRHFDAQERNTPEFEALAIMGLEPPINLQAIKVRYKELAKKHHPDLNRGCQKSEELLKRINMAYTILKLAYEKFDGLPQQK